MMRNRSALLLGALFASKLAAQSCLDTNLGTDLLLGDDQLVQGLNLGFTFNFNGIGYTQICVDSNGSIYLGGTTTAFADYSSSEAEFLASPNPRICGLWSDFNAAATGSGHIFFNAVPASGSTPAQALVTWNGVYEYQRTTPITVQIKLDAGGIVSVHYGNQGAIGGTLTTAVLTGMTTGVGAASNPVSLATRPTVIGSNSFSWVQTVGTALPAASGFTMQWLPTNPGFVVADVSCQAPASATVLGNGCYAAPGLGAGDDTTHLVNLPFAFPHASGPKTQIYVSSNGFVSLTGTDPGSGCCGGNITTMLAAAPRIAGLWSDLDASAAGGGEVYTSTEASGAFVVSWVGVEEFAQSTVNNFQIALYPTGDIQIRYGSVGNASHTVLCGYSDGNGAADPGATDLSVAAPGALVNTIYETFLAGAMDLSGMTFMLLPSGSGSYVFLPGAGLPYRAPELALTLAAAGGSLPRLNTTLSLEVSNISAPPNGNVVFLTIGFTELAGVDLGVIGAPGCNAYVAPGPSDLNFLNVALGAATTTFNIGVPNNVSLLGIVAVAEAYSDTVGANALGFRFSNGVRLTVGP